MKNTEFISCCNNVNFQKKGDYWICNLCGKKYHRSIVKYQNMEIFDVIQEGAYIKYKLKGRKVNKINDEFIGILYQNKYYLASINCLKSEIRTFEVDKNIYSIISNGYQYIATKFSGKILLYCMEKNLVIRSKINRKLEFICALKNKFWLVLEDDRLCIYDLERNHEEQFADLGEILQAEKIKIINNNMNYSKDKAVIYFSYIKDGYDRNASIMINCIGNKFDYNIVIWDELYQSMEYVFDEEYYFGIYGRKLCQINNKQERKEILSVPLQVTITDGGMFKPERFVEKPNKIIIWKDCFVLLYMSELIIINRHNENIIFNFIGRQGDLIQSCELINEKCLSFSCGQNVYIVEKI